MSESTELTRAIGRVSIVPKPSWSKTNSYTRLDLVVVDGQSYLAVQDVPINIEITNTTYWMKITSKGREPEQSEIAFAVQAYIVAHPEAIESTATVDPTLTVDGAAADAQVTGNVINNIMNSIDVQNQEDIIFTQGNINSGTGMPSNTSQSKRIRSDFIYAPLGISASIPAGFRMYIYCYNTTNSSDTNFFIGSMGFWYTGSIVERKLKGVYIRLVIAREEGNDNDIAPSDIGTFSIITYTSTDKTLSITDKPADAKITGDNVRILANLTDNLYQKTNFNYTLVEKSHYSITTVGSWNYATSQDSYTFSLNNIKKIEVTGNANGSIIAFLNSYDTSISAVDFSLAYSNRINLAANEKKEYIITDDMNYFYVLLKTQSAEDKTPLVDIFYPKTDVTLTNPYLPANAKAVAEAFEAQIVPSYNSQNFYKYGDLVLYNNILYRCNTTITSFEEWNDSHWDIVNLKDALDSNSKKFESLNPYGEVELGFVSGGINSNGALPSTTSNTRIRTLSNSNYSVVAQGGDNIYVSDAYFVSAFAYNARAVAAANLYRRFATQASGLIDIPLDCVGKYIAISITKVGHDSDDISEDIETIQNDVKYYRVEPVVATSKIDTMLTKQGYVAESKATGDAINNLKNTIEDNINSTDNYIKELIAQGSSQISLEYTQGGINSNGSIATSNNTRIRTTSNKLTNQPITHGDYVFIDSKYEAKIAIYNSIIYSTDSFITFITESFQNGQILIPDIYIGKYVGIAIRKIGYEDDDISADIPIIQQYIRYIKPQYGRGYTDGELPVYVAFGASTTEGVMWDNGVQTKIHKNVPNYISSVLGLETYNLAVGNTGFLSRYGADNNIMDLIYNNEDLLSRAKLITITFGYGNDHIPGSQNDEVFRIGNYDDYYPYDQEGYHPSGDSSGILTMIEKGATLMGCLNWCIKWINEKYPFAQLIIIFGSPSACDERTVTMTSQTEGIGVAPYKLSFNKPFAQPSDRGTVMVGNDGNTYLVTVELENNGQNNIVPKVVATLVDERAEPMQNSNYTINYGIWRINRELKKLQQVIDIPIINLFFEGNAFDWYSTYAKNPNDNTKYALFSTVSVSDRYPIGWNPHPNEAGYLYYARFIAGKIISLFKH